MIQSRDSVEGWRGHLGTHCIHHLLQHKSEKASHGRLHTAHKMNSSVETPHHRMLQLPEPPWLKGSLNKQSAQGYWPHRDLFTEPSSGSLWARNWYNTLGKWYCTFGSNLRLALKCHPQSLENRQAQLQLSLQHKTSAVPGQFTCVGFCWHNHSNKGLINHLSLALFPHPTLSSVTPNW